MKLISELYKETYGMALYEILPNERISERALRKEKKRMAECLWDENDGDEVFFNGSGDPADYEMIVVPQANRKMLIEIYLDRRAGA